MFLMLFLLAADLKKVLFCSFFLLLLTVAKYASIYDKFWLFCSNPFQFVQNIVGVVVVEVVLSATCYA